ncbi:MAG: hypothetical protein HQ511_01915 [Rhodospirillales bacterium]|nr:hypothetical protein [Rhodospirillales bacterium]
MANSVVSRGGVTNLFFALGLCVFAVMAGLGGHKLQFGMNFIDEGMYMADGWRLAAGDSLFPDSSPSVVRLYALFNAVIFELWPDVTLLEFRWIQYGATMLAILAMSLALYRTTGEYWYLPWIMSLFAFTGLDPVGMSANLSYYTYPHLFATLHTATLLLALVTKAARYRASLLVVSGVFLWAVGFCFLPLAASAIVPLVLWGLARVFGNKSAGLRFSFKDALSVTAPVLVLWIGVLAKYNTDFVGAVLDMLRYFTETSEIAISRPVATEFQYYGAAAVLLALFLVALRLPRDRALAATGLAGLTAFAVIETNLFGAIELYWRGWFAAPMWFAALLIAFSGFYIIHVVRMHRTSARLDDRGLLILFLLVPGFVIGTVFAFTSGMGPLAMCYVAIPVVAGLSCYVVSGAGRGVISGAATLVALLFPFYYATAWADWRFTYFDLPPAHLNHTVENGFAKGIRTNAAYAQIIGWIEMQVSQHSSGDDLAVFFDQVPMGYMIARRRPSIDHSWAGMAFSPSLRRESTEKMVRLGREPTVAFKFHSLPLFLPLSLKDETFSPPGRQLFAADNPLNNYVVHNMELAGQVNMGEQKWIELFIQKSQNR